MTTRLRLEEVHIYLPIELLTLSLSFSLSPTTVSNVVANLVCGGMCVQSAILYVRASIIGSLNFNRSDSLRCGAHNSLLLQRIGRALVKYYTSFSNLKHMDKGPCTHVRDAPECSARSV